MRLNQDCIRYILLELEERLDFNNEMGLSQIKLLASESKYDEDEVIYSILKLIEADYLIGAPFYAGDELHHLSVSSLTWNGHLFLDTIRDNQVWKETKSIISKFSSVSLSLVASISTNIVKEQIKKQLNL